MKALVLLLHLLGLSFLAAACSCAGYEPDFFKRLSYNQEFCVAVFKSVTVENRPDGTTPQTAHFTFQSAIQWSQGTGDFVVIGQDGLNCGEAMFGFQAGDTMVLALKKSFLGNFGPDTLYLNGCERNYLTLKNGQYNGMTVQQISQKIKMITGLPKSPSVLDLLSVHPNPATGKVTVQCGEAIRSVLVLNSAGQEVFFLRSKEKELVFDMSQLLKGLYYVHVKTETGEVTRRVMKQ